VLQRFPRFRRTAVLAVSSAGCAACRASASEDRWQSVPLDPADRRAVRRESEQFVDALTHDLQAMGEPPARPDDVLVQPAPACTSSACALVVSQQHIAM